MWSGQDLEHTVGIIGQQIHNGFYNRASEELGLYFHVSRELR